MNAFYEIEIERKKNESLITSLISYDEHNLRKGRSKPQEPFEMEISEGKILYDIVGFQDTSNFAISKRLYDLLLSNGFDGWKSFEIKIKGQNCNYYGFQVTGKCGKLEIPKKAGFYTGYQFDHETWDKSDFFSPDDTMILFCTERVKNLFDIYKITNAELENINSVQAYSVGR